MHSAFLRAALTALATLAALQPLAAQLQGASTNPSRYSSTTPFADIHVLFNQPVDPATFTATSFAVFGRWSGVVEGALSVDALGTTAIFRPSRRWLRGRS